MKYTSCNLGCILAERTMNCDFGATNSSNLGCGINPALELSTVSYVYNL